MEKAELTREIKKLAMEAGFDKVGVAPVELPGSRETDLMEWLARGFAGSMEYMAREPSRRAHPEQILPGAKSVLSLALNYYQPTPSKPERPSGKVALYARGRDYHDVIGKKLKSLKRAVLLLAPGAQIKTYVDTGPIMEKAFAQAAGIGFYGKNTNILTVDRGSWFFLASLITDLDLERDAPHPGGCGTCRLCIDACPTGALVESYKLDATKCISYWTIESKEEFPPAIAERMGEWAFGCDICQDICPFNRKAAPTAVPEFAAERGTGAWLDLESVAGMDDAGFTAFAKGSPLKRPKRSGLVRNARAVLSNLVPAEPGSAEPGCRKGAA